MIKSKKHSYGGDSTWYPCISKMDGASRRRAIKNLKTITASIAAATKRAQNMFRIPKYPIFNIFLHLKIQQYILGDVTNYVLCVTGNKCSAKKKKKSGGGGLLGQIHLEYASCYKIFRNSQYILRYYVLQDGLQSPLFTPEY